MFIICVGKEDREEKRKNIPIAIGAVSLLHYRLSGKAFLCLFTTQLLGQCNS